MTASCLRFFLLFYFRIIFILIRYVTTIAMKAFYDEALLKLLLNTATIFSWYQSTELLSVFMQSVHRASRPHGMAYFIIVRI